jgi:hypothetical protein
MSWNDAFKKRMHDFENGNMHEGEISISIKIKAEEGCFHRSCCPNAFKIIDPAIFMNRNNEYEYVEHESGPELLVYLGLAAAGLSLTKSIIDLVTLIIKARFEGQKRGDNHKNGPVSLIVRRVEKPNEIIEERIMTFNANDKIDNEIIKKLLQDGCSKIVKRKK